MSHLTRCRICDKMSNNGKWYDVDFICDKCDIVSKNAAFEMTEKDQDNENERGCWIDGDFDRLSLAELALLEKARLDQHQGDDYEE